jgi:hypothetical protein
MWTQTHSIKVRGVTPQQIWKVWSDISIRHLWDLDTEWAKIEGPFQAGASFQMKVKDGPTIKMQITESIPNVKFTDSCRFPLGKLYGEHWIEPHGDELLLSTTIRIEGILGYFWRKIIGEKVAAGVPEQTQMLIALAKTL